MFSRLGDTLKMKASYRTILMAAACAVALAGTGPRLAAQSAADVAAQELELKKKELEVEKARLAEQKTEELEVEKAKLEVERQKLELEKARRDLQVRETRERLDIQLEGDVLFDTNQAVIKPEAKNTLEKVAIVLAAYPEGRVTITGHADSRGSDTMNLKLSRDRAEAVKTWLLARSGASSERIIAFGEGEEQPAASNETASGRQLNRRVEISVAKL